MNFVHLFQKWEVVGSNPTKRLMTKEIITKR